MSIEELAFWTAIIELAIRVTDLIRTLKKKKE